MTAATIMAARTLDAGVVGHILTVSNKRMPWLPKLHSAAEDIRHCGDMIDAGWVRCAQLGGSPVGFIARRDDEILSLYVLPEFQGQGVGTALLAEAKATCATLRLWCFAQNLAAAQYYGGQGFGEIARTDGHGNEVKLPDIQFQWVKGGAT
jgi:GNAT superfamily N-acetyltransferase